MRPPRPSWTEHGFRQTHRLPPCFRTPPHQHGCFLRMMAWPTGHHEPPCRAHLVHTEETDLEIIYRPELHRNHCVCCCCGNGDVARALGLQGPRRPGRQSISTLGGPAHTCRQGSPRNERRLSVALLVGWLVSWKTAPPGCLAAGGCWVFVQTFDEIIQSNVPKSGRASISRGDIQDPGSSPQTRHFRFLGG